MKGGQAMRSVIYFILITTAMVGLSSLAMAEEPDTDVETPSNSTNSVVILTVSQFEPKPIGHTAPGPNAGLVNLTAALGGLPPNASLDSLTSTSGSSFLSIIGGRPMFDQGKRPSYIFSGPSVSANPVGQLTITPLNNDMIFADDLGPASSLPNPDDSISVSSGSNFDPISVGHDIGHGHADVDIDSSISIAIPTPGGIALLMGAFLCGRRRKRA